MKYKRFVGQNFRKLRFDVGKIVASFLFGLIVSSYLLRTYVWDFFRDVMVSNMGEDLKSNIEVVARTPFEVPLVQIKIGVVLGLIFATVMSLYVIYNRTPKFQEAMAKIPHSVYIITFFTGSLLFISGLWYNYNILFPTIFSFLATATVESGVDPFYSISDWTEFMIIMSLSFGVLSQIPIYVPTLVFYNVVSYKSVRELFRYWIVGILVAGAFLSPPEPISQLLWSVPLISMFGLAVLLSRFLSDEQKSRASKLEDKESSQTEANLQSEKKDSGSTERSNLYRKILSVGRHLRNNIVLLSAVFILTGVVSFYGQFRLLTEKTIKNVDSVIPASKSFDLVIIHPVELLMFQAKLSGIVAILVTGIVAIWKIWPELHSEQLVTVSRTSIIKYSTIPVLGLILGALAGILFFLPFLFEIVVSDTVRLDVMALYQIKSFFWIVLYTVLSVGISVSILISIPYWVYILDADQNLFIQYWRHVIFAVLVFSVLITPTTVTTTMMFVLLPVISYLGVVGALFIVSQLVS